MVLTSLVNWFKSQVQVETILRRLLNEIAQFLHWKGLQKAHEKVTIVDMKTKFKPVLPKKKKR